MKGRNLYILQHIILALIGIIWIYPFIWTISSSFKSEIGFFSANPWPGIFHFANFARAWNGAHFSAYFMNTVITTVATVALVIAVSSLTGYALGRVAFPGRKIIIGIIAALLFVPQGFTIIPFYQLMKGLGLNNNLLGIILGQASGVHIMFILMFSAYFRAIPQELEDAASMDGCGFLRTFLSVMLPTAKPVIATVAIMQFISSWNSFLIPLVLTLNSPNLRTLAVGMFSFVGTYNTDYTAMAAAATISVVPVIIIFIFAQRYFMEGIAGAVKS
ncbi:carbohydrate ABC transporter permease [Alicyclobacillus fodiniaquatilis]|uniref:Carbohydrate ABC transporter permease n=1 Tax=Alicyclobacillus fodiniaquatilis TaxID=1661150 RepID=A0ABW4JFL9_9BACL